MPVFVTGGTGFLGVNLIRSLVQEGESVRALVRPTSPRVGLESSAIEFVEGDVTDLQSLHRGIAGCSRVYHLAGWVQVTPWGLDEARRINVGGTKNVCRACLEHGVTRLLHTSSIAAVGHGPMDAPATEETDWNFRFLNSPYHTTKRESEQVVRDFVGQGLDAVIVNPAYVIGPFDIKPSSGEIILRVAKGKLPGYPNRGGIGFVDVREVVSGMRLAMDRGRRGERYILNGENISYGDFVRRVAKIACVKPPRWPVPYWLLYPPVAAGTLIGHVWPSKFTHFNLSALRAGFCDHYISADKARRELGVACHPIDTAIADTLAWFRKRAYLS